MKLRTIVRLTSGEFIVSQPHEGEWEQITDEVSALFHHECVMTIEQERGKAYIPSENIEYIVVEMQE